VLGEPGSPVRVKVRVERPVEQLIDPRPIVVEHAATFPALSLAA